MQMQEPEQWQQPESEWQRNQEYGEYQTGYSTENEHIQQQKIYPHTEQGSHKTFWAITILLASMGFLFTITGIIASSLVLEYTNGPGPLIAGGVIGLVSSILALLICIGIFVIAVVALAGRIKRGRK
jgi:hypothetical protein